MADEDVVVFGYRDASEQLAYGSPPLPGEMKSFDLAQIRSRGVDAAAHDAIMHLTRHRGPGAFWIHLDADVLHDTIMPAVDYRLPDGLSWDELAATIRIAMASQRAIGLEITIYNPKLDSGRIVRPRPGQRSRRRAVTRRRVEISSVRREQYAVDDTLVI